jgi:orotate phosphoribosyltransferase
VGGERLTEAEVLEIFRDTGALWEGHFVLRSGLHSRQYFQCALLLQQPPLAERLCRALAQRLPAAETTVSPALGGLLVGHELARAMGARHVFAEKNAAGNLELRRGFRIRAGERCVVAEDVVTEGGRVRELIEIVRRHGGEVVAVAALVDRSGGRLDFGVQRESLLKYAVETFQPAECPMCKEGIPSVKPGS